MRPNASYQAYGDHQCRSDKALTRIRQAMSDATSGLRVTGSTRRDTSYSVYGLKDNDY